MTAVLGPTQPPASGVRVNWRSIVWQVILVAAVGWLGYEAISNAAQNMRARNIPTDFSFWFETSGFDITQSYISYSATSTYGRAFLVSLINTLIVAAIGIVFATIIGFLLGVARLSDNWMVSKLATAYIETLRNIPLLLQLLFWYNAVLKPLPGPRQSIALPAMTFHLPGTGSLILGLVAIAFGVLFVRYSRGRQDATGAKLAASAGGSVLIAIGILAIVLGAGITGLSSGSGYWAGIFDVSSGKYGFLNGRGLYIPAPVFAPAMMPVFAALVIGILAAWIFRIWAKRRQARTGEVWPIGWAMLALILIPPAAVFFIAGAPVAFDLPKLRGFNLAGGWRVYPEFFALLLGLSLYTATFIAEIVRAGILAVPRGQSEAASALGLRRSTTLKLIIIPQAMRVIVPPLTNQYLNLTKNSSLAVFIGYPDLVQVFAGTVLNQTGAAVQVIAITMAVYLVISLFTSIIMNIYNRRVSLVER